MSLICNDQYNIGHICTRQQCEMGLAENVAMRFVAASHSKTDYTFGNLDSESNRFANILTKLGYTPGDIFFTFIPKLPEQFFAILGGLKARTIVGTLFSNFGDEAIFDRIGDAKARGILTKRSLLPKILRIRDRLPHLKDIIVVDGGEQVPEGILNLQELMKSASDEFETPITPPDTPSLLHYTSGSTGKPKGVLHAHGSIISQHATAKEILNLYCDDIYWCTADQGWVTGTSYGIIGPWSLGVTQIHYAGGYDPQAWFTLLQEEKITSWYTAPTALRMLMQEQDEFYADFDLSSLRHIFSVGEPLNPEVIGWAGRVLGKNVFDTWFQTETGSIMIANRPGLEIRPGSMGQPVSGVFPAIVGDDGHVVENSGNGNLCLKTPWPSMFVAYLNNETVYCSKFKHGFYYSGDSAYCDDDGYFWFLGRNDDIINTAGHLVSPFEVESALLEIQDIAESGVIGAPDSILYEKVVAFVKLHKGIEISQDLKLKIQLQIMKTVSPIAVPREIQFVDSIPKNKSGKIMRRILKARYLGEDEGDTSTLEI